MDKIINVSVFQWSGHMDETRSWQDCIAKKKNDIRERERERERERMF